MNVLRDNIVIMLLAVVLYTALSFLYGKLAIRKILSTAAVLTALATVAFLLYRGATVEELFLTLIVFGAVSVTVGSFRKSGGRLDNDGNAGKTPDAVLGEAKK